MEYLYPGGLPKAMTFSYDDGQVYDRRLVKLFDEAGFKATFHLNSGNLGKRGFVTPEETGTLYQNHEVACHGVTHRHPLQMTREEWLREVWQDRRTLEALTGRIVQGMSYAFGEYTPAEVDALRAMGIRYSRTVSNTGHFGLPQDFMLWQPTCHHNDCLLERADKFLHTPGYEKMPLFYIWGHSFEFRTEEDWALMEQFCQLAGGREDTWYATNIEIVDYMADAARLQYTAAGDKVCNPNAQSIWVEVDGRHYEIPAGKTVVLV